MRISDWSSDVCSSDLTLARRHDAELGCLLDGVDGVAAGIGEADYLGAGGLRLQQERGEVAGAERMPHGTQRSEEHTSELQSLMRISYAVFCLKQKHNQATPHNNAAKIQTQNNSNKA